MALDLLQHRGFFQNGVYPLNGHANLENYYKPFGKSSFLIGTLWLFNIAMENSPFKNGLPNLKMGGPFHGYVK
jgi:hypothetical protein